VGREARSGATNSFPISVKHLLISLSVSLRIHVQAGQVAQQGEAGPVLQDPCILQFGVELYHLRPQSSQNRLMRVVFGCITDVRAAPNCSFAGTPRFARSDPKCARGPRICSNRFSICQGPIAL
jgi:hypothetical protein